MSKPGIDYDGQPKVTTAYLEGADPATGIAAQVVRQDLDGDVMADLNTSGAQLTYSPPSELSAPAPMTLVGSTANGNVDAGWLVDIHDDLATSQSVQSGASGVTRMRTGARPSAGHAFALAERGEVAETDINGIHVSVRREAVGKVVVTDVEDRLAMRSMTSAGDGTTTVKHSRTYRKEKTKWVISEDVTEVDEEDSRGKRHHETATRFTKVRYVVNASRDSLRRVARPTTEWIPLPAVGAAQGTNTLRAASGQTVRGTVASPARANRAVMCDEACQGGGYVPPNAYPTALGKTPPCSPADVGFTVAEPANADVNILYQHGFKSTAQTWCQGSEYVRARLRVGYELRHTLPWQNSYEEQADELSQKFDRDLLERSGQCVLVGHSNGGRVNRYMAQSRDAANVAGVVTVSSPHAGAYLANLDQTILTTALAVPIAFAASGCDLAGTFICSQGARFGAQVLAVVGPMMLQGAIPVTKQMGTDAAFSAIINGRGDQTYKTAGVQNRMWDRWTAWRLIGDNQQCEPHSVVDCDAISSSYPRTADRTYHGYIKCSVVSGLFGFIWPGSRRAAVSCARSAASMFAMDYAYKRLSVGSAHGDGVVPEHSQIYPGSPVQVLVDDSNSHIGETRSRRTANGIAFAISQSVGTPFVQ
jgi:pimeloyl-ACP methyl ester carboxylesterase